MADQIVVSETALGYLNQTRPWVKFLAILGFIVLGIIVLCGLAMMSGSVMNAPGFGAAFGILYLVLALLYYMPCLFLYRYSKAISTIPSTGQAGLEEALKQQKSFWKFMGILTAVVLCIEVVVILITIFAGAALRH